MKNLRDIVEEKRLRQIIKEEIESLKLTEQTDTELNRFVKDFESVIRSSDFKSKIRPAILHIFSDDPKDAKPIDFQALGHVLFDLMKSPNESDINDICNLLKNLARERKRR
jgi:RNA polymerase-interacting CarD/CdnL/TRCF family regulator